MPESTTLTLAQFDAMIDKVRADAHEPHPLRLTVSPPRFRRMVQAGIIDETGRFLPPFALGPNGR